MKVEIEAPDGRILARVINLAARIGCTVESCQLAQSDGGAHIVASFAGDVQQLRRFTGQLSRLISDEQAEARFSTA